jgi:hypothetical protein
MLDGGPAVQGAPAAIPDDSPVPGLPSAPVDPADAGESGSQ